MYSVRRFSTTLSLEERDYNIVSDLYRSGLGRTSKKIIGRTRRSLGNSIEKSITSDIRKLKNAESIADSNTSRSYYPKVKENLSREAKKRNSEIVNIRYDKSSGEVRGDKFVSNYKALKSPEFKEMIDIRDNAKKIGDIDTYKEADKAINDILGGKNIIYHSYEPNEGVEALSHEIGHSDNYISKNPIKKFIHSRSGGVYKDLSSMLGLDQKGLVSSVKNYLKGLTILGEESNATRTGIKLLKRSGVDNSAVNESSRILRGSLDTYKYANNINSKYPMRNSIQIPSRRNLGPIRIGDRVNLDRLNDGFGGGRIKR